MMNELVGGLIQMNSHMEQSGLAVFLLVIGVSIALVCGIASMYNFVDGDKKFAVFVMVIAVMGVIAAIVGAKLPREQIIHACADGQVSLEQVAGRYDIINVDGNELTLRVR